MILGSGCVLSGGRQARLPLVRFGPQGWFPQRMRQLILNVSHHQNAIKTKEIEPNLPVAALVYGVVSWSAAFTRGRMVCATKEGLTLSPHQLFRQWIPKQPPAISQISRAPEGWHVKSRGSKPEVQR